MKILHILKSEPDDTTKTLMDIISEGEQTATFKLYEGQPDYGSLLDLLFEYDKSISWW
jgi:hypothetical protein